MAKRLVIVESPAKANTVHKYLGPDYLVKASMGHIRDLPKNKLGIDIEHDFEAEYVIIPERKQIVVELQRSAKECESVLLAADPDREGEAICWHLNSLLGKYNPNIYRVLFHEITKGAVGDAFSHLGQIDQGKIEAQQTRRLLDRLVGYLISPLLWKKIGRGLSAGRVQSIAMRLICEREKEIKDFVPEEYWTVIAELEASNPPRFKANLVKIDGKKAKVKDGKKAGNIVAELRQVP
ncbi:MAG: toprim domain-containing protein, partial [Candidatus Aminicenantes bacterium]|nr:toprim domain-containing protein [Candidatus Aminicenantes bacterium]